MGALMLRAVDEGVRAADVGKALGISTRRAQTQLRRFREMSAPSRAQSTERHPALSSSGAGSTPSAIIRPERRKSGASCA
jgi:hypothetical protein